MNVFRKKSIFIYSVALLFYACENKEADLSHVLITHQYPEQIHVEPHLSIHPTDDKIMVCASIYFINTWSSEYQSGSIRLYATRDRGKTWASLFDTADTEYHQGDPWTIITEEGHIYLSTLDSRHRSIVIYHSKDWGQSWNSHVVSKFENGSYDHPIIQFLPNEKIMVSAAQNYGTSEKAYGGLRIIIMDHSFNTLWTEWIGKDKKDFIVGNPIYNNAHSIIAPMAQIATFEDGYQHLLDTMTSDILYYNLSDSTFSIQAIASHSESGSFPVALADQNEKNTIYFTRHIYEPPKRSIHLWYSKDGGNLWSELHSAQLNSTLDQHHPQLTQLENGDIIIAWLEQDKDDCYMVKIARSSDQAETIERINWAAPTLSCNTISAHKDTYFKSGRSIADRFGTGGDYFGLKALGDQKLGIVTSHSKSGLFQLYYSEVDVIQ